MKLTLAKGYCSVDPKVFSSNQLFIKALLAWGDKWKISDDPPTWEFPDRKRLSKEESREFARMKWIL